MPPRQISKVDPLDSALGRVLPIGSAYHLSGVTPAFCSAIEAVILDREIPANVQQWLESIPDQNLPRGRFVLAVEDVSACLKDLFEAAKIDTTPALAWLCQDATELARTVSAIAGSSLVRMRIEPIFDNACSKFHIDHVVARLICTYRGPGTQLSLDDTPSDQISAVPTGKPVLLKGKLWPQGAPLELKHRSPPIAGTGLSRLVLVLEGCDTADILPEFDHLYPVSEVR